MLDPVGITGTAIAIAGLLYSTCNTICEIVQSFKDAPKEYRDLSADLEGLCTVLISLQNTLNGTSDTVLSQEQKDSLSELQPPLERCNATCTDFKNKLSTMMSHSDANHTAVRDRFRLHFNKSDVSLLREKLSSTKGTVQIAIGVSTL